MLEGQVRDVDEGEVDEAEGEVEVEGVFKVPFTSKLFSSLELTKWILKSFLFVKKWLTSF